MISINKKLFLSINLTILTYFFFSLINAFVKQLQSSISPFEIFFFYNFISFLVLLFYYFRKKPCSLKTAFLSLHLIRDITGSLSFVLLFFALQRMNFVDATILAYTTPFITPFIWRLWTKEKIEKSIWWTTILGFIGIVLILDPEIHMVPWESILALLSALFSAIALISINHLHSKKESSFRILFYFFFLGTLLSLPALFFVWKTPNLIESFMLVGTGLLMVFGQIALTAAYRHENATFLSPISYSMILFATLISWLFFNQIPSKQSLLGAFLVIFGGTLTILLRKNDLLPKKWWEFWKKG